MNRSVLIITHDFPPAGGPGVQRVLKFAKYLPEFGYLPIVLTAKPEAYLVLDETLMRDVPPATPIYHVADPDVNRLRPAFERLRFGKLLSAINLALMLPDSNLFWALKARSAVRPIVAQYQPAVMFSSAPPASAHILAQWTHRQFGIPWVADYRDPWSQNFQIPYLPGYRALNRWLEKRVLKSCNQVTTVSQPLVEMYQQLSQRPHTYVNLVENGYDESDITCLPPPRTERFTIAYTGTFSRLRRPDAFIAAVRGLLAAQQIPPQEIRVALAGKNISEYVPKQPPFEDLGYLSHPALYDLRQQSDLLLLILHDAPTNRGSYSSKIFEYLGCNRPTLCITDPENVAAKLIVRARGGVVVRPQPDAIAEVIMQYYRAWKAGVFGYDPDWDLIRQFTRRRLTQRLSQVFNRIAHANQPNSVR